MSNDGFVGKVKIGKIEIKIAKNELGPIVKPYMEMSGEILACEEADFDLVKRREKTCVVVRIHFFSEANSYWDLPAELANTCVGDMSVHIGDQTRGEVSHPQWLDIHAVISLVLNQAVFNSLVTLKDSAIIIDPVFYREEGKNEKKTRRDESGDVISYIERMYFSPIIE